MFSYMKREPGFYRNILALAMPIVLQNLVTNTLALADTFMVGLLGEVPMAGVTLANIPFYALQMFFFGVQSGAAVLISQYWGKGDRRSISRILGLSWLVVGVVSIAFSVVLLSGPARFMGMFSNDPTAVDVAARYGRIVCLSYVLNGFTLVYLGVHRSIENPRLGLYMLSASMITNTFLNWVFIFGKLGAPAMGVEGAALATLISRCVELGIVLVHMFCSKHFRVDLSALLRPGRETARRLFTYATPVIINESLWGIGTGLYPTIMGHMENSTEILAAYTVAGNVEKLALVALIGLANTAAIVIGREIGAGRRGTVYEVGLALNLLSTVTGFIVGLVMLALSWTLVPRYIFPLFQLSDSTSGIALIMLSMIAAMMAPRAFNFTNIVGVLRGGGDVRAATVIDLLPLWTVAIPAAALFGLVLKWGVFWLYVGISLDQIVKCVMGIWRLRSGEWINDVTVAEKSGE
ncbi:MAG: MATE family efflux transporter [Oscillospiraceae bacterium]|nr:MATE family efflux transporter [Oscillospiraceae bacterium]